MGGWGPVSLSRLWSHYLERGVRAGRWRPCGRLSPTSLPQGRGRACLDQMCSLPPAPCRAQSPQRQPWSRGPPGLCRKKALPVARAGTSVWAGAPTSSPLSANHPCALYSQNPGPQRPSGGKQALGPEPQRGPLRGQQCCLPLTAFRFGHATIHPHWCGGWAPLQEHPGSMPASSGPPSSGPGGSLQRPAPGPTLEEKRPVASACWLDALEEAALPRRLSSGGPGRPGSPQCRSRTPGGPGALQHPGLRSLVGAWTQPCSLL